MTRSFICGTALLSAALAAQLALATGAPAAARAENRFGSITIDGHAQPAAGQMPGDAFPASVWHYAITGQSLLFDLKTLQLMHVQVARSNARLAFAAAGTMRIR